MMIPPPKKILALQTILSSRRGPEDTDTPEGNQKYLEFYEGKEMKGKISYK
jgi:hypothetical protein